MTNVIQSHHTLASTLPVELPIFPLSGAVLLPGARLPLNVFEPRHLALIEDALGKGRLLGMIQPSKAENQTLPPLYSIGCAGRISAFNETDDGRLLIVLTGVCRFRVIEEMPISRLYRTVKPEWKPYLTDLDVTESAGVDRERLIDLLHIYFKKHAIGVDWNVVQNAPNDVLLSTVIMISPFAPNEKQALLEAESFAARADMLMTLLEMAVMLQTENEGEIRH
jgi:Lon protease-like protein